MREKHSSWLKLTEEKKENTQESRCTNCCNGINLKFWHKICLRNLKRMSTVARETERGRERHAYMLCVVLTSAWNISFRSFIRFPCLFI